MELMTASKRNETRGGVTGQSSTVGVVHQDTGQSSIIDVPAEVTGQSSIVKSPTERLAAINRKRVAAGLTQAAFCGRASIDQRHWRRLLVGQWPPREQTLDRLEAALADLPAKRPPQIVKSFHRMVMIELCRRMRAPIEAVLATDFSVQRPSNENWLRAARIKRMAIYITAVELELGNAELARALGDTRQNIKQARDDIEDLRDKRTIDKVMTTMRRLATGKTE